MYKNLQEHLDMAYAMQRGRHGAAARATDERTQLLTHLQPRPLEQHELAKQRMDRFSEFVTAAGILGSLLSEAGIQPDVRVHRSRLLGKGKPVISGWALEETFYEGRTVGISGNTEGLVRDISSPYDSMPPAIRQLVVTGDRGVVRYAGEPVGLKPIQEGVHNGVIVVKDLDVQEMSGASLASSTGDAPDKYLAWLANTVVHFDIDPGMFGLPSYQPRHAA